MAALCERVLTEQDGVLSLIRVVDRITQAAAGEEVPEQMPPFLLSNLNLVVMLKAGEAQGRYAIKLRILDPSGVHLPERELPVHFEQGNRGTNIVSPVQMPIQYEGVYWFEIFLSGRRAEDWLLTRIPLQVLYQPQRTGSPQES
jgi:hypothetical protein